MTRLLVACLMLAAAGGVSGAASAGDPASGAVSVPFSLDHNRMIVEVEFLRPDGSSRNARAWVDTGEQWFGMAEPLARELGIDLSDSSSARKGPNRVFGTASPVPPARLGGLPLEVGGIQLIVNRSERVWAGVPAEAKLPACAFRALHVVFDYPAMRLLAAAPGVVKPRGAAVPCRVAPRTGLFMITATLDGRSVPLGIDTGSAGTWLSDSLIVLHRLRHPKSPAAMGAAGSANFFGFDFEAQGMLMRLPELGIGPLRAPEFAVLGLGRPLFDWYSTKSAEQVLGFIGANVLRGFRLEVDFPNQMTYWEAGPAPDPNDLDIIGLTLRPESGGSLIVAGVVEKNGKPVAAGVRTGDRLVRVGDLECTGSSMGPVVEALRGRPGEKRTLLVEREGKRISIEATVQRLP